MRGSSVMHSISKIVLAICLSCLGCTSGKIAPRQPVTKQVWPTAERPIVLDQLNRGGGLIFGGPDGNLRNHLANNDAYARYTVSANAKVAACVSLDWKRTKARWVTFFDCSGEVLGNVMLPTPPRARAFMLPGQFVILLSNRGEAIVTIGRQQYYDGPMRPGLKLWYTIERYYVLSDGTVKMIEADKDENIKYLFPPSGGIVMLRTSRKYHLVRPWQIERYDEGLQLRWKKEVNAGYLDYLESKYDFSLHKHAESREFLHFRQDGTFVVEQPPHD